MYSTNKTIEVIVDKLSKSENFGQAFSNNFNRVELPSIEDVKKVINVVKELIFPEYFASSNTIPENMKQQIGLKVDLLFQMLKQQIMKVLSFADNEDGNSCDGDCNSIASSMSLDFIGELPKIRRLLISDAKATFDGDPAAKSYAEIIYCYPGIRAITNHRIAHEIVKLKVPLIPRIISELSHSETGIDIHPSAEIGSHFMIDHGTGVVIGETAIIGNNVKIYQGVTLGARSFPLDKNGNPIKNIPRHPIIKDNVEIYSNATILGRIEIGENSIIGGNVWITRNVPSNSRILQHKYSGSLFTNGSGI